jgi:signal transduction histidine kinase
VALLCYGLLIVAWILDLLTPQLFIAAILLNGPIALSSLALRSGLTINLVVAAEIANATAGYVNGLQAGHHWDGVAIGDRLLLAASFVLVGYLSVKTQEFAREAGVSSGRMRQIEIERALREATARVRETLNVELVERAITRESVDLLGAARASSIARETPFATPLTLSYRAGDADIAVERQALSMELASLVTRAQEVDDVFRVTGGDALGRLTLATLGAGEALVARIAAQGGSEHVLIACVDPNGTFVHDALPTLRAFSEQASMALEQAHLFAQLGEQNEEIARQKDELADRSDVIRDIVYALAHDLRTPLTAAHVSMTQAIDGAYGELPERYRSLLRTALAANDDERRIVETLLLVARYEAGEASTLREPVELGQLGGQVIEELQAVGDVKGVVVAADFPSQPLRMLGDPHEIRRAMSNLVANAIEATPSGGHVVVHGSSSNGALAVTVEDDGYGVPPERREALFQRFAGGQAGGGTGLGLYIVRRIAEKHGGSVAYAERSPRGSAFTLSFPAAS